MTGQQAYINLIRSSSSPMTPRPTGVSPRLERLRDIEAVVFDVYGTMLISGSGDIGTAAQEDRRTAFCDTLAASGLCARSDAEVLPDALTRQIERCHASARRRGIEYPEVEIREVWRAACRRLCKQQLISQISDQFDFARLAIDFELRFNPVWPMPGLLECLSRLRQHGSVLGIISNAQFFTPLALAATTGKSADQLGFDSSLRYYSFEHSRAKPDLRMYQLAAAELLQRGIESRHVLYVGNDMRNDIWPAARVGFRTALFAGDARSLRLREDAPLRQAGPPEPDCVVTELAQLPKIVEWIEP